jgi:hypothetical protein
MNDALNSALFDKLTREQDKYRDWLKSQPPEEILNHAYEYTVREDILMSMEELELSEGEARALLLSPAPMAILYDAYLDRETSYMDTIRDSIEDLAKDEAKKLKELPVYPYHAGYAREHEELDVYRASLHANVSCKEAIEDAIREHYRDNSLGKGAVAQVVNQFGYDRILFVLANTVRHFEHDGRISETNKAWSKTIPIYENNDPAGNDRTARFVVNSHPGLTDLFLSQARRGYLLTQPLTADEIRKEALRLLGKLQEPEIPNSPNKTHFMAEISRDFSERAGSKDTEKLQRMMPFNSLTLSTLKDRSGVYAMISKEENRNQSLRQRKPSVRNKLQKAVSEAKPSPAKRKDMEL